MSHRAALPQSALFPRRFPFGRFHGFWAGAGAAAAGAGAVAEVDPPTIPTMRRPLLLTRSSPRTSRCPRGPQFRPPCLRHQGSRSRDHCRRQLSYQRRDHRRRCRPRRYCRSGFRCLCIRCWSGSRYCRLHCRRWRLPRPAGVACSSAAHIGVGLSTTALAGAAGACGAASASHSGEAREAAHGPTTQAGHARQAGQT